MRETGYKKYSVAFVDTEIEPKSRRILDIGSVKENGDIFHESSLPEFIQFIKGSRFACGHNILTHDIKYIGNALDEAGISATNIIDTLYLSPLLFPTKPYHALVKDDKLQSEETNNPLNDSIKARDLFYDEVAAFREADEAIQQVFYLLLHERKEFHAFFRVIDYSVTATREDTERLIRRKFSNEICEQADLASMISETPIELTYCLSLINSFIQHQKRHSITPPWVLRNWPEVEGIMFRLRNKPCITGCAYCHNALDAKAVLRVQLFQEFRGRAVARKSGTSSY